MSLNTLSINFGLLIAFYVDVCVTQHNAINRRTHLFSLRFFDDKKLKLRFTHVQNRFNYFLGRTNIITITAIKTNVG